MSFYSEMSPAVSRVPTGPMSSATDVTPAAMAAAKLGMIDKLLAAIDKQPRLAQARDSEGECIRSPTAH